jgi:two-component system response regulator GlrR
MASARSNVSASVMPTDDNLQKGPASSEDSDWFDSPTSIKPRFVDEPVRFGRMVGRSASMRTLFSVMERAAESDATVLLEGETGTGKDATAKALHEASPRRSGPFVIVDCGAIPPQLMESELFGNERGAFTGAVTARAGAFEAASGGTIFLDEVGELSLDLQPKILRILEDRHVKRIGSNQYVPFDVRVIAATNRGLRGEVEAKRFRSDLYYRLAVVHINLPPLRERMADIPLLVQHELGRLDPGDRPELAALRSPEFVTKLSRYRWPGNIRQLRNYLERCVALRDPDCPLGADTMPPPLLKTVVAVDLTRPLRTARDELLNRFELAYIEAVLAHHDGNVSAAARAAGVDRVHFYRLLRKHGLREGPH